MRRMPIWRMTAAFVAAMLATSCDFSAQTGSPVEPEVQVDELRLFGGRGGRPGNVQQVPIEIVAENQLTFIKESLPEQAALSQVKLLGYVGGVLNAAGHTIHVPVGAVLGLTRFSMERVPGDRIVLELHANRGVVGWLTATVVDLFRVPVTLEMSYAHATNLPDDLSRLRIVRFRDDGTFQVMPTEIDTERKVIRTKLEHFSLYAMASN